MRSPSSVRIGSLPPVGKRSMPSRGRVRQHRQRAELRGGLALAGREVRGLADEVGGLHLRAGQAGLDRVVLALELRAHEAVALLDPARDRVDADADRHHAVRLPRVPERVPEPETVLHLRGDLPAEVADVGDPEHRHRDAVDQRLGHRAVRERRPARGRPRTPTRTRSRAFGPHTPIVHSDADMSVNVTEPSAGRYLRNQYWSRPPSNAPVTTRKCSSPRRWIVRSPRKPPSGVSSGV